MKLVPRSYQTECVNSIYNYFQNNSGNPICALPTGTGKSVVIAMFLESAFRQFGKQKVLVLTHVKELIQQNYDEFIGLWPEAPAGIYSSGLGRRDTYASIIFAGIASVAKRAKDFGYVDLILIDEAHLVSHNEETMYQKFLSDLRVSNSNLKVIGFTATPWRLGQGHIVGDGGIFTDTCFDITDIDSFNRLIAEKYLAPLIPRKTRTLIDTDNLHIRAGEFVASELQMAVDVDAITDSALREALELAKDRKHWLIFASGVQHAINISKKLTSLGEPCAVVHSKMSNEERDSAIALFKSGKVRAIANNNVLTTGFNMKAIDCIIMLRPTASSVLWVQMLGRGTRVADGKENCLVLDYAGNTKRLGPINDPVMPRKKGSKPGEAPIKVCDVCGTYNHTKVRFCICCDAEFKFEAKIKEYASSEELLKGELPQIETFKVDTISYSKHTPFNPSKQPSMLVEYYCGLQRFKEYVLIEHGGFGLQKAQKWWRERSSSKLPSNIKDALLAVSNLAVPTHIRVWINKKWPDILGCCYDGSAFGMEQSTDVKPKVTARQVYETPADDVVLEDEEIPF